MGIGAISGYSSIYSNWYAAASSGSHVVDIGDTPVNPVNKVDPDASGNVSVEMIYDTKNAAGIKPSGGILTGVGAELAKYGEDFSMDMMDMTDVSDMLDGPELADIVNDMMAGSRWAMELNKPLIPAASEVF